MTKQLDHGRRAVLKGGLALACISPRGDCMRPFSMP